MNTVKKRAHSERNKKGDLEKPSLGAICLLQSVPQIHFFKFRELSNLILEGDVEKPSLGAICLLQSVPQIDSFYINSGSFQTWFWGPNHDLPKNVQNQHF